MLRGEVWLINLDPTIGAEIKKTQLCKRSPKPSPLCWLLKHNGVSDLFHREAIGRADQRVNEYGTGKGLLRPCRQHVDGLVR